MGKRFICSISTTLRCVFEVIIDCYMSSATSWRPILVFGSVSVSKSYFSHFRRLVLFLKPSEERDDERKMSLMISNESLNGSNYSKCNNRVVFFNVIEWFSMEPRNNISVTEWILCEFCTTLWNIIPQKRLGFRFNRRLFLSEPETRIEKKIVSSEWQMIQS